MSLPAANLRVKLATIKYAKARLNDQRVTLESNGNSLAIHRHYCERMKTIDVEASKEVLMRAIDELIEALDHSIRSVKVSVGEIDKSIMVCEEIRSEIIGSN